MNKIYVVMFATIFMAQASAIQPTQKQSDLNPIQITTNLPGTSPFVGVIQDLSLNLHKDGLKYPFAFVPFETPMKQAPVAFFETFIDHEFVLADYLAWLNKFYGNINHRVAVIFTLQGSSIIVQDYHDAKQRINLYSLTFARSGVGYIVAPTSTNRQKMKDVAVLLNDYMDPSLITGLSSPQ